MFYHKAKLSRLIEEYEEEGEKLLPILSNGKNPQNLETHQFFKTSKGTIIYNSSWARVKTFAST